MNTVKLVSWLMHSSLVCSRFHWTNADMDNMDISISVITTTTATTHTSRGPGGDIFPAEQHVLKVLGWKIPWPLAGQWRLAWARCWPHPHSVQLCSCCSHHNIQQVDTWTFYRYTVSLGRSPLNSVKISFGYWRGLQVDWGYELL